MNYPIWQLDYFGGGLLVAVIAIFHVYISHFAVGGGLFLVLTELKAARRGDRRLLDFVYSHSRFFLLVTMVAGGITGVGIWFIIALLSPAATSNLIHTFVFAWATEWVFFVIEIVALFLYYYCFHTMERRQHLRIGWIYFGAAWMSLFIINGIIDFMLTPGAWLENGNFWSGFFNPTFWPSLFFRTFFAIIIAGLFGLLTATWIREDDTRISFTRYSALWLLLPFALFLPSAWWYRAALPAEVEQLIFTAMPDMSRYINGFLLLSPVLILGGLVLAIRMPAGLTRPLAGVLLLLGLAYMGCFEFIREGGRHPYLIHGYMYSNSLLKSDLELVRTEGLLKTAKWVRHREATGDNQLEAGREVFNQLCLPCHSVGGPMHDILDVTDTYSPAGLDAMISGFEALHPVMPPFAGNEEERRALAVYIATGLHGREDPGPAQVPPKSAAAGEFDADSSEYVLLAWSSLGLHTAAEHPDAGLDNPDVGDTFRALLILRGELPEIVTEDVRLHFQVEEGFAGQAALSGIMAPADGYFASGSLPLQPFTDSGGYDPSPIFTIEARRDDTVLAATRLAVAVAAETGCNSCHGGPWRVDDQAGMSGETLSNILKMHDRRNGTDLHARSAAGTPVACRECHRQDPSGEHAAPGLSASIHGFHANYLSGRGADACAFCHPSTDRHVAQSLRGIHAQIGLDCTNCHGTMEDHSLSLLRQEMEEGRRGVERLMSRLSPQLADSREEIQPRRAWTGQPDCLTCHVDFEAPETDLAFNVWTADSDELYRNRTDESGQIPCAACHSAPHAIYPAENPQGEDLDNLQPLQYQGNSLPIGSNLACAVCHTVDMEDEMHHPNMLREFRNQ